MYRKNPIDLSHAHLVPERIKQYALNIFDEVEKYPKVNSEMQRLFILLIRAENILKQDPLVSDYFAATRKNNLYYEGLKALIDGDDKWYEKRKSHLYDHSDKLQTYIGFNFNFIFHFFLTYYLDNNLSSPMKALRGILKEGDDKLPPGYEFSLEDIKFTYPYHTKSQGKDSLDYYSYKANVETASFLPSSKPYLLFNHDLLQDYKDRYLLRPVFVVENFQAANKLEMDIKNGEIKYLLQILGHNKNFHRNPSTSLNNNSGLNTKPEEMFNLFCNILIASANDPAYGDAVVTAAVGGYSIPEYSDWSLLDNRDIYIFKFGEKDPNKYLSELLAVTACIKRDNTTEITHRIKFIVMAEKNSVDVDHNTIEYWSLSELFENAEYYKCSIPSELESDFDSYRRKNAPIRTNPYVIQPFLRRKSWMLLTGEEGTGKSYMAMALGAAIATGGKLFLDWKIRQRKASVLYIVDEEMTQEIIRERMQILKKLYKGCENNFIIEQVKRLNLLENGKEFIKKLLYEKSLKGKCVEVLILDHLLKLSNMHGDEEENWPSIRILIEDLTEQGIAVILLHHEYAGQRMLGTRLIAADAPARVHLDVADSTDEDKINFNVSVIKNRGGKLDRQIKLVTLQLGKHPKWLLADSGIKTGQYKFKEISRDKRIELVKQYRAKNWTNKQIAEKFGCSLSSIEKIIKDFPDNLKK